MKKFLASCLMWSWIRILLLMVERWQNFKGKYENKHDVPKTLDAASMEYRHLNITHNFVKTQLRMLGHTSLSIQKSKCLGLNF